MRNTLAILSLALLSTAAQAVLVYDNGSFTTGVGNGAGGNNTSQITTGYNNFGYGVQNTAGNYIADNFTLSVTTTLDTLRVFSYQSFAATTNTFTGGSFSLMTANPTGAAFTTGNEVAGNLASVNAVSAAFTGVYRVTSTTLTNADRAIYAVDIALGGVTLGPGTYYAAWGLTGSIASGPWAVPVEPTLTLGNARQYLTSGTSWGDMGANPLTQEAAFQLYGEPVPEPATMLVLGGAIAAFARRRRK